MNAKKALINQIGRKNKKQAEEPQPSVEKHKVFTHLPYFSPSLSSLLRVPTPIPLYFYRLSTRTSNACWFLALEASITELDIYSRTLRTCCPTTSPISRYVRSTFVSLSVGSLISSVALRRSMKLQNWRAATPACSSRQRSTRMSTCGPPPPSRDPP